MKKLFRTIPLLVLLVYGCTRESLTTGPNALLELSDNGLHFDPLFTSTGSVTQSFKIYNRNNRKLLLNEVSLAGGASSPFRINVDGFTGPGAISLEIGAHDSLYVFVTVKINPSASALPFVIEDSIRIHYNGNEEKVQLQAWGRNAHFFDSRVISTDTTWTNDKPFVVLGGLLVKEGVKLTIAEGTRVYLHADAPLLVDGTLVAEGSAADSLKIVFQGDRLDEPYRQYPGAWPGIFFRTTSSGNLLKHVIVKNAYQGIVAEASSPAQGPKLHLQQCIIDNCYDAGILGVGTAIEAENCLVSNCGKNILLVRGGSYAFTHCTAVSISNAFIRHDQPVLTVTNYIGSANTLLSEPLQAKFTNCIFWGESGLTADEVVTARRGEEPFQVSFSHCLWKLSAPPGDVSAFGMILNEDPLFRMIDSRDRIYDFRVREGSPVSGAGLSAGVGTDLDGVPLDPAAPDIGCYETF